MIPEIFKKDWFDGRTIDAISADDSKRIGWDNELSNYSEFLFDENYLRRLIDDNELICEEFYKILDAMDVGASIRFSKNAETAYTDGNSIVIDSKFLPNKKLNINQVYSKFDVLIGLLIHEACHCKYTDFEYCKKNRNLLNEIIHSIHNILEDECIERNIGLSFPGYSNFIKAVKIELFKKQLKKKNFNWSVDDLQDIFNLLLITVRYPDKLKIVPEEVLEQHSELFEKIRNILDFKGILKRSENVRCTRDTISAAIAIYNLLNIDENGAGTSIDELLSDDLGGDSSGSNGGNKSEDETESNDGGSDGKKSSNKTPTMADAKKALSNSLIDPASPINIDSVSETINETQEQEIYKELTYEDAMGTGKFGWNGGYGVNENIKEWKTSNSMLYNKLYGDIKQYIKDFQKIIVPTGSDEEYKKIDYQRSGQLDPNQIINALQGGNFVNTKLQKTVNKKKPKYALVLNLDESGSMFGDYIGGNIRMKKDSPYGISSRLAVLFYEAMKDYKELEIYIYGHGDNINRYIFPKRNTNKYVLGNRQLQGGQNDAASIKKILSEVRANTQLPIIMVNITDSLYLSLTESMTSIKNDYGDVALTLMCVSQISKNHLTPDHIETNNKLYGEGCWVTIDDKTNLRKIALKMAEIFKKQYKARDRK